MMYQKVWRRCKVIDLLTKSTAFLMFSLHHKLPNLSVFLRWRAEGGGGGGGGRVLLFNHFAQPP